MNVIKLYGGLGNQMFQYGFGMAMEKNGIDVTFETSFFDKPQEPPRPFCLHYFHTHVRSSTFSRQLITVHETPEQFYKCEPSYLKRNNCNFFGYWQNIGYIKDIFPKLLKEFTLREESYTEEYEKLRNRITSIPSVSLHVRRGDYVSINGHVLLPLEYYSKALAILREKSFGSPLYVFSDDLPWCKQFIVGDDITFVDLEEVFCLELMSLCKYNIIANSTFSWWAAILNRNKDKLVIAPNRWRERIGEQQQLENGGFINNEWIRI